MARITVEDCLKLIGSENRFALIHLAIARLKQHRNGMPFLVEGKNKEVVMTLREIAAGAVTSENLKKFEEFAKAEAAAEATASVEAVALTETAEKAETTPVTKKAEVTTITPTPPDTQPEEQVN